MEFSSKNKQSFQGFLSALTGFFSFTNLKAPHAELSLTDLKPVSILYPQQSLDSLLRALARAPAVDLVSNVKIGLQRIRLAFVVGALLAIELGLTLLVRYLYAFYIEKVGRLFSKIKSSRNELILITIFSAFCAIASLRLVAQWCNLSEAGGLIKLVKIKTNLRVYDAWNAGNDSSGDRIFFNNNMKDGTVNLSSSVASSGLEDSRNLKTAPEIDCTESSDSKLKEEQNDKVSVSTSVSPAKKKWEKVAFRVNAESLDAGSCLDSADTNSVPSMASLSISDCGPVSVSSQMYTMLLSPPLRMEEDVIGTSARLQHDDTLDSSSSAATAASISLAIASLPAASPASADSKPEATEHKAKGKEVELEDAKDYLSLCTPEDLGAATDAVLLNTSSLTTGPVTGSLSAPVVAVASSSVAYPSPEGPESEGEKKPYHTRPANRRGGGGPARKRAREALASALAMVSATGDSTLATSASYPEVQSSQSSPVTMH